jgi:hypothetical protein
MPKYGINTQVTNDFYNIVESDSLENAIALVNALSLDELAKSSTDFDQNRDISMYAEIGE